MQDRYHFDHFEVRPAERLLLMSGLPVAVGARAFDLLLCLLTHRDRVISKGEIIEIVWPDLVVEENNLSVQISTLRKLLGPKAIATVPGRGYRFSQDVRLTCGSPKGSMHLLRAASFSKPKIAVLPFNVLSDDPQITFLADGLVEDVIALLARVPGFLLISRSSSFIFRGQDVSVPELARQLDVRFVVEGSLRQNSETLKVSTTLIDAATGQVLWSGRFDRRRNETVDLQVEIARGIISELEPELTRAEIAHIRRQRPENLDAWAHYHQAIGSIALKGWGKEAMAEARNQLKESVALDPAFGLGYAHYALLTVLSMKFGYLPDAANLTEEVMGAADKAMGLDDGSSEVLGYAGCALCDLGHHDRGVEVLHRALEIDPSNAQAHVALGASLGLTGKLEEGIKKMRFGMEISPRDRRLGFWGWALGNFLLRGERIDEALVEARKSSRRDPKFHYSRVLEAAVLDRQGHEVQAGSALAIARQLCPTLTLNEIALIYGRRVSARMAQLWNPAT
jgi:TolB-like protein/Tfp pilus assembly protein PilF